MVNTPYSMLFLKGDITMLDMEAMCDRIDSITEDKEFVQALREAENISDFKGAVNEKIIDLLVQHQAASKKNGKNNLMIKKIDQVEDEIISIIDSLIYDDEE